jgi:ribonucleoside-triphosphate reductase
MMVNDDDGELVLQSYQELMPKVRTSDGFIVSWNREAIAKQLITETKLAKEFYDVRPMSQEEAQEIAFDVERKILNLRLKFVSGPLIRELVNNILLGMSKDKPEYTIYRNILTRVGAPVYDAYLMDMGQGYKANENANLQPNAETSHKRKADWVSGEEYLLLMPQELADAHLSGDLHIHDLEYFGTRPFCQDWDLRYFFYYGLMPDGMGTRTSVAGPAKHPEVAILHTAKILASAQTNFAGGEGFYNFLVFLAPFMRGLSYERIKQLMQMMFFEYTQAYVARGGQLVFSNIQVQPGVPELWRKMPAILNGRIGPDVYGDFEDEVRLMFKALYEVALHGDFRGKPFNFPKLENSLSPEFFRSEYDEVWLDVHKVVARFGTPYFDNLMPPYRGYGKGVSCYQCCAYCFVETPESSPEFQNKMNFVDGKHFSMGSLQVVSLNLPRIAYKAKGNDTALFEEARRLMDHAVEIFRIKRKWMDLVTKRNRIPFATQRPIDPITGAKGQPAIDFDALVSTIGFVGGNEMAQHHTGYQLHEHPEAIKLLVKLILEMQRYKKELESRTGIKLALARTPAESTAQRFAVADLLTPTYHENAEKIVKGDLPKAQRMLADDQKDVSVYYSNGTHVYVGANVGLLDRIDTEQKFFPLLNGGNMLHVWLGEAAPDPEALYTLTKRIANQTQVGYYAYTKDLTVCNDCGVVSPLISRACPNCASTNVEWWSRVTGYYQAVSGWNEGKKRELQDRFRVVL